nr:MAG TPA: hypothetical protein [Caudoviricetes sp.]
MFFIILGETEHPFYLFKHWASLDWLFFIYFVNKKSPTPKHGGLEQFTIIILLLACL